MLAQEEGVGLGAGQTGAVDSGLLARAHTHGLSIIGKADGVTLGVFQGNQGYNQVDFGGFRQVFILGNNVLEQLGIDLEVISALLEGDAEDLLGLLLGGNIGGVDGNHVVAALAFGFQDFQRLVGVAGGDDTVGDLSGNQLGGGSVTNVGQGHPVAEGAHPVSTPGPGVGAGQRTCVQFGHIVHEAGFFQGIAEGLAHGGGGGRDVLEGGDRHHAGGFLQFFHQLPGVQGIQKVDVARTAIQNGDGQVGAVRHVDAGRLLVGVAAVFQCKFVHFYPPKKRCAVGITPTVGIDAHIDPSRSACKTDTARGDVGIAPTDFLYWCLLMIRCSCLPVSRSV